MLWVFPVSRAQETGHWLRAGNRVPHMSSGMLFQELCALGLLGLLERDKQTTSTEEPGIPSTRSSPRGIMETNAARGKRSPRVLMSVVVAVVLLYVAATSAVVVTMFKLVVAQSERLNTLQRQMEAFAMHANDRGATPAALEARGNPGKNSAPPAQPRKGHDVEDRPGEVDWQRARRMLTIYTVHLFALLYCSRQEMPTRWERGGSVNLHCRICQVGSADVVQVAPQSHGGITTTTLWPRWQRVHTSPLFSGFSRNAGAAGRFRHNWPCADRRQLICVWHYAEGRS